MDQGSYTLELAAPIAGPSWAWEPREGMQFSGRKEYVARFVAYASARRQRFIVTKDTGITLEHTCQACGIGKVALRIKRMRNGRGGFIAGPATIKSVLSCSCTIGDHCDFSNLTSFVGLEYKSRSDFTDIGKAYFSGRRHSRRDSGCRIDYRCLVCRNGHLAAVLTPGISEVTSRPTWTAPLTIVTAVNCTEKCACSIDLDICDIDRDTECVLCSQRVNSPVELLCCRSKCKTAKKYLCHECLQGWVDRRRNDHGPPLSISLSPVDGNSNSFNHCYSCPGQCGEKWSEKTRFKHCALERPLHELCKIPIGFANDQNAMKVEKAHLQVESVVLPNSQDCLSSIEDLDRVSLNLICQSVAEQSSLEGRYNILELNGFTNRAEADDFLKKNHLYPQEQAQSVADTCATGEVRSERRRASLLRKQTKMEHYFNSKHL